jgi:hypothetical protein
MGSFRSVAVVDTAIGPFARRAVHEQCHAWRPTARLAAICSPLDRADPFTPSPTHSQSGVPSATPIALSLPCVAPASRR